MSWLLYVMLGGLVGLLLSIATLAVITGVKLGMWAGKRRATSAPPSPKQVPSRKRRKSLN